MLDQFIADISALLGAIQAHSVSAIIVAVIAVVSLFSSQLGAVLQKAWGFVSGLFGGNQPPAPPKA